MPAGIFSCIHKSMAEQEKQRVQVYYEGMRMVIGGEGAKGLLRLISKKCLEIWQEMAYSDDTGTAGA